MKTILVEYDDSCEMARVSIDNKLIMEGNRCDFHPGCHGLDDYGEFNNAEDLALKVQWKYRQEEIDIKIITKSYKY